MQFVINVANYDTARLQWMSNMDYLLASRCFPVKPDAHLHLYDLCGASSWQCAPFWHWFLWQYNSAAHRYAYRYSSVTPIQNRQLINGGYRNASDSTSKPFKKHDIIRTRSLFFSQCLPAKPFLQMHLYEYFVEPSRHVAPFLHLLLLLEHISSAIHRYAHH